MKNSKYYRSSLRWFLNLKNRHRLENHDFTIISSNCTGGVIYHELGMRFLSPTINLWFSNQDFIKFVSNLNSYLTLEVIETESDKIYPVGRLGDITVYFMHYHSFNEAKKKWEERCQRINFDNLYIIMTANQDVPIKTIEEFNRLPYKHKVVLTEKDYGGIEPTYQVAMPQSDVYDLCRYKSKYTGKRWIDDFDYVGFLNNKS